MFSTDYKRYVLGVLTTVYTLNFIDRGLVSLLLQPIKADLHLSDTQLGFLTGIAFGLFYAVLGLPIARRADRSNRVTITSIAIGLWGATVIGCVFVTNFVQLVVARLAAAVGEAGCMPPTYSLVGDYFPKTAERTRAMAIYTLGGPLSALIAFILGGWLNERYGWRLTFFIVGIPGLLISLLVKATVREPRAHLGYPSKSQFPAPRMSHVLGTLWRQPSSRHLVIGVILLWLMGSGLGPWEAAFMMRTYGVRTSELGLWWGGIFGLGGVVGILLSGYLSGRYFAQNERGLMRMTAVTIASLVPCLVSFLLLPGKYAALLALIPLAMAFNFFVPPSFALLQRLVGDEMRATSLAVVMLLANTIGMGIGPQLVGVLSDLLAPTLGVESLRYAMLMMSIVAVFATYHFWCVGRTVTDDLLVVARRAPFYSGRDGVCEGAIEAVSSK